MPPLEPVRRDRVSDGILVQLTNLLMDRVYEPGDRLPPERDLALQLGVNRASLREALRRMEAMGLVFIRQGGGITVQDYDTQAGIDFVLFILKAGIHLDTGILADIGRIRVPFTKMMVSLAMENIAEESIRELEEIVGAMADATLQERQSGQLDFAFFLEIAKATQNRIFVYILNSIKDILKRMTGLYVQIDDDPGTGLDHFKGLVEAFREGDEARALTLLEKRMREDDERFGALMKGL